MSSEFTQCTNWKSDQVGSMMSTVGDLKHVYFDNPTITGYEVHCSHTRCMSCMLYCCSRRLPSCTSVIGLKPEAALQKSHRHTTSSFNPNFFFCKFEIEILIIAAYRTNIGQLQVKSSRSLGMNGCINLFDSMSKTFNSYQPFTNLVEKLKVA